MSRFARIAADVYVSHGTGNIILIFGWSASKFVDFPADSPQWTPSSRTSTNTQTTITASTPPPHRSSFAHTSPISGNQTLPGIISDSSQRASVAPVIKLLRDAGISEATPPHSSGLLVHTFSNALAQTTLARAIASSSPGPNPALPAQALVFDSLPGVLGLGITARAFTAPIRSRPLRALAKLVVGAVYILAMVYKYSIGAIIQGNTHDTFTRLHADLNDPRLLPLDVPRTYLYSDVDDLIPMHSVEAHAHRASQLGAPVSLVKFAGSPHVAHARTHPQQYWDAVTRTWNASLPSALPLHTTQSPSTVPPKNGTLPRPPFGPSETIIISALPVYAAVLPPVNAASTFLATTGACPIDALNAI
ncbi:Guanine nucleotide-binding protein alpha-2 subunit [Ceratobasidium theobromae]|uniref:Guanine nucleotide-binding protein alpha-2 subunit n=1 Tax=Ceratobasidium theobromae TaxID=1582974 RepID=A0A5N5QPC8_9AGAM|nr:Guanine nucleotide-binding protein alpha-2 subunit [Ceratobasidium theobromae]